MLTIDLEPELETSLNEIAEKIHISPNELVKQWIAQWIVQPPQSDLLIDIIKKLPKIACFENKDPLEIQKALRDEWN